MAQVIELPSTLIFSSYDAEDPPSEWLDVDAKLRETVVPLWIEACIKKTKSFDPYRTSYGMKHTFARWMEALTGESSSHFYLTNGAFKGCMLLAGYRPKNPSEQNWKFNSRVRGRRQALPALARMLLEKNLVTNGTGKATCESFARNSWGGSGFPRYPR